MKPKNKSIRILERRKCDPALISFLLYDLCYYLEIGLRRVRKKYHLPLYESQVNLCVLRHAPDASPLSPLFLKTQHTKRN